MGLAKERQIIQKNKNKNKIKIIRQKLKETKIKIN